MRVANFWFSFLGSACAMTGIAAGQKEPRVGDVPAAAGIAARHVGDRGIEKDPNVLFHEDFEQGGTKRWDETKGPVTIVQDSPNSIKIDCLWLQHYGYDDSDPTKQYWGDGQTVWFDDIVVATGYIGPIKK